MRPARSVWRSLLLCALPVAAAAVPAALLVEADSAWYLPAKAGLQPAAVGLFRGVVPRLPVRGGGALSAPARGHPAGRGDGRRARGRGRAECGLDGRLLPPARHRRCGGGSCAAAARAYICAARAVARAPGEFCAPPAAPALGALCLRAQLGLSPAKSRVNFWRSAPAVLFRPAFCRIMDCSLKTTAKEQGKDEDNRCPSVHDEDTASHAL